MTPVRSILWFAAFVALSCCGCRTATPGYRNLSEREITLQAPKGLAFPAKIGQFQRSFAEQKLNDPATLRVGYEMRKSSEHTITITVKRSNLSPTETLRLLMKTFITVNPNATVKSTSLFPGWQTVVFDYNGFVANHPPEMRHQPRQRFYGVRSYGGYALFLESTPFYPHFGNTLLPAADQLVRDLFPNRK